MGILATELVKYYRNRLVVDHVSVSVERGEVIGLLGPNGAGKTTTFQMIVGLIKAESGRMEIDRQDITYLPMYQRAKLGLAYLPQEPSVFRKLTVEQNLQAIIQLLGLSRTEAEALLDQLLQEFNLTKVRKQKAAQLSGGERRRTEIARALAARPSFLLLDEPFSGIDPIAVGEIQEIIADLRSRGLGILITDHNVRETLRITDRAYILHQGRVLVAGSAAEVAANQLARQHYLGANFVL